MMLIEQVRRNFELVTHAVIKWILHTCSMHKERLKMHTRFQSDHLGGLGADERILLKSIFKK